MIVLKKLGGIHLSALVALFAAVVMLCCLVLPYAVSTDEYGAYLDGLSDIVVFEKLNITGEEMNSLSMVDYATLFTSYGDAIFENGITGWIYVGLLAFMGLFGLITMLFSLMHKAIPTGIFALLTFGPFFLFSLDLTQRGFVGSGEYTWGVGYYLFHAAVVVAIGCAVWMFIDKRKAKKAAIKT